MFIVKRDHTFNTVPSTFLVGSTQRDHPYIKNDLNFPV